MQCIKTTSLLLVPTWFIGSLILNSKVFTMIISHDIGNAFNININRTNQLRMFK